MRKLGLNGNRQEVVRMGEVKRFIEEGLEYLYTSRQAGDRQTTCDLMSGAVSAGNTRCSAPTKDGYPSTGSARRDSNPRGSELGFFPRTWSNVL